jgi:hypothetical protein
MAGIGAPGEIRTPDPLIRSQVLYPAELRAPIRPKDYIRVSFEFQPFYLELMFDLEPKALYK